MQVGNVTADIRFEIGTLEGIFADPDGVLSDVEGFWQTEDALRFAAGWHGVVGVPVDYERFRQIVGDIARLSSEERQAHPALVMARRVIEQEERFARDGIPHLCAYLPDLPARLDIRVLFAAGLRANAFVHEHVVIDATSPHWHEGNRSIEDRASSILNLLVHECWHGGYCENQAQWTERALEDDALYRLLINIQNEGTATYVNYSARTVFPSPGDPDFVMLEDAEQVAAKFAVMNRILGRRFSLSADALRDLAWREGVLGRAFYIGGAHMARTLDERAGRRALTDTIAAGPASFFDAYDRVADDRLRVRLAHD
jgi:hypothetical protein